MNVSFVSIQGCESTGWEVVKKTFPKVSGSSVTLSVTAISMDQHCEDQKTAEFAAKKIAELNALPYVSDSASVITVTPFCNGYLPVELTPSGSVVGQGTNSPNIFSAVQEGMGKAESRKLLFIAPGGKQWHEYY